MLKKSFKSKTGFTLIEILVVVSLLTVVGTFLVDIFIRTIQGNLKAQILATIKQNGQVVLDGVDKTVRGADHVVCPNIVSPALSATSDTLVLDMGDKTTYTRYRFIIGNVNNNGVLEMDQPAKSSSGDLCDSVASPISSPQILTNNNQNTGVNIQGGAFIRTRPIGFKDEVTINFNVAPPVHIPGSLAGQIDPVHMETTIVLR